MRENLILSGMICIAFGAFLSVGGVLSMGAVIGVSGILLFIVGMSTASQRTMSEEDIADGRRVQNNFLMQIESCTEWMLPLMSQKRPLFCVVHVALSPNLTVTAPHRSHVQHATPSSMRMKRNNQFDSSFVSPSAGVVASEASAVAGNSNGSAWVSACVMMGVEAVTCAMF